MKRTPLIGPTLLLVLACAPLDEMGVVESPVIGANGLRVNGLRVNGLRVNGLRVNGLRVNGLRVNGLESNPDFVSWFNEADGGDIPLHDNFMTYVVACALASDQSTSFTDVNGVTHTWLGSLGLAPGWLDTPPSTEEASWISACLLAHVNSNGNTVQVSLRGAHASLATTPAELSALSTYSGGFFGDLFDENGGYYACSTPVMRDESALSTSEYQTLMRDQGRECPIDGCAGTFLTVDCATACTPSVAPFTSCTADGLTFDQVVNVSTPRYVRAFYWIRTGLPALASCSHCLKGQALNFYNGGKGTTGNARASSFTSVAGSYVLEVRYANGSSSNKWIKVQVNGATVMNGASSYWDFAPTGGWDSWATRGIPVSLPSSNTISLVGGGKSKLGPLVDLVFINFP